MAGGTRSDTIMCAGGMPAFLSLPAAGGPHPVIVLMHERYGLAEHTRDLARRCAADGFVALSPNFFFRHPDQERLGRGDERYDMSDPEAVELLHAALAAVEKLPSVDMARVAVGGYCQTGRHPIVFAAERRIQAAIVWYGAAAKREWDVTPTQPRALEQAIAALDCPLFAAFGAEDHIISLEDVRRFRNALEQHGKSYRMRLYEGAPHGWLNDTMPGRYRKPQADAAWGEQQEFLRAVFAGEWDAKTMRWDFHSQAHADYDFSKNVRKA